MPPPCTARANAEHAMCSYATYSSFAVHGHVPQSAPVVLCIMIWCSVAEQLAHTCTLLSSRSHASSTVDLMRQLARGCSACRKSLMCARSTSSQQQQQQQKAMP
jgi:hypothetical protein